MSENRFINIITESGDRKWILYRLAEELKKGLPYKVELQEQPNLNADINYYMNYDLFDRTGRKKSKCDVGWFTHPENEKYFLEIAGKMDWCFCHAQQYENLLRHNNILNVSTITPGVDEQFKMELKIGVVGKKYDGIRKGADVVEYVQQMYPEFIKVYFTHSSWGVKDIPFEKLNEFYQAMDFILIPSRLEGGPMPVMEALACGKEVIANHNVGNISLFGSGVFHYETVEQLNGIMGKLLAHKLNCRRLVKDYTWQRFADEHKLLFEKLWTTNQT